MTSWLFQTCLKPSHYWILSILLTAEHFGWHSAVRNERKNVLTPAFRLHFNTINILGHWILGCGGCLCIVGYWASSLVLPTRCQQQSLTYPRFWQSKLSPDITNCSQGELGRQQIRYHMLYRDKNTKHGKISIWCSYS